MAPIGVAWSTVVEPVSPRDFAAVPYLAVLPEEAARQFASRLTVRTLAAREDLCTEGDAVSAMYIFRKGRARILRTAADGREQAFRLAGPGDTVGEVPLFDGGPAPATVQALEPSEVIVIPAAALRELVAHHPEVAAGLLRHFAARVRAFTELVQHISLQTVPARLARYLHQVAREEGIATPAGVRIRRSITQHDLASLLGSSREVVARALKVMADDGVIEISRNEILVLDVRRLREQS